MIPPKCHSTGAPVTDYPTLRAGKNSELARLDAEAARRWAEVKAGRRCDICGIALPAPHHAPGGGCQTNNRLDHWGP